MGFPKILLVCLLGLASVTTTGCGAFGDGEPLLVIRVVPPPPRWFYDYVEPGQISGPSAYIDHELVNGDASRMPLIMRQRPEAGGLFLPTSAPVGTHYDAATGRWAFWRGDFGTMPNFQGFSVLAEDSSPSFRFIHHATPANIVGARTTIDSPLLLNDNPSAMILVSPIVDDTFGSSVLLNPSSLAVYYDAGIGRWQIKREDGLSMMRDTSFVVSLQFDLFDRDSERYEVTWADLRAGARKVRLTGSLVRSDPSLLFWLTRIHEGALLRGLDSQLYVEYDAAAGEWLLCTLDPAAVFLPGMKFNMVVRRNDG